MNNGIIDQLVVIDVRIVKRSAQAVKRVTQKLRADSDLQRLACRFDDAPWSDSFKFVQRHQKHRFFNEADNLCQSDLVRTFDGHLADFTDEHAESFSLDDQSDDFADFAISRIKFVMFGLI